MLESSFKDILKTKMSGQGSGGDHTCVSKPGWAVGGGDPAETKGAEPGAPGHVSHRMGLSPERIPCKVDLLIQVPGPFGVLIRKAGWLARFGGADSH